MEFLIIPEIPALGYGVKMCRPYNSNGPFILSPWGSVLDQTFLNVAGRKREVVVPRSLINLLKRFIKSQQDLQQEAEALFR
ncbi:MAG: hypothetical protein PHV93_03370 [Candidatus Pacebacteria bacterium]|nr:hypothetical protein [Candidatus Paceibacterota bacterium]